MEIILKTTMTYNSNELSIRIPISNDDTIDTIVLERRYAGWYATLDYTDANGISRSLGPDDWVRYRDTYTMEYSTNDAEYTVKITEHAESDEVSICVFRKSVNDNDTHTNAHAPTC